MDSFFELKILSEELQVVEEWVKQSDLIQLVERTSSMIKALDEFEVQLQNLSIQASLQVYSG